MLKELAGLGFRRVELSHGIKVTLVEGILRAVDEGIVRVGSCHNFCPLPPGITTASPNLYKPSSKDRRERSQWLRHTRRSIDFAAQVGARSLVMHLGSVEFFWFNPAPKVEKAAGDKPKAELMEDPAYKKVLAKANARLRKCAPEYWQNVKQSLQEVLPYAAEKGIRLCFENREAFDELPIDDAFPELLQELEAFRGHFCYWHDTGHAALKDQACIIDHASHLRSVRPWLGGFHLHDISPEGRDHQPVGTGLVDWETVKACIEPDHQLVIEPSPRLKPEQVVASREVVEIWGL